jgi:hypothetical protein
MSTRSLQQRLDALTPTVDDGRGAERERVAALSDEELRASYDRLLSPEPSPAVEAHRARLDGMTTDELVDLYFSL